MGRPKMSDLCCSICNEKFKKKSILDEHMENHLNSKPSRKLLKNYCYVCRKSFDPDKYKLHLQVEHPFDFQKIKNEADALSCEEGFVLLSKRKITKSDSLNQKLIDKCKPVVVSVTDIKLEQPDNDVNKSSSTLPPRMKYKKTTHKKFLKVKIPSLKCKVCGFQCKGKKGLKIHMSSHKRFQQSSRNNASLSKNDEDSIPNESPAGNTSCGKSVTVNYAKNQSPNSSLMNSANLMVQSSENVPKFDCDSEKYLKWLKTFVSKCKMYKYPLSPELCRKISIVTGEITVALGNPQFSLNQKANHFYFMSMYSTLTEIMLKHLQHTLCV